MKKFKFILGTIAASLSFVAVATTRVANAATVDYGTCSVKTTKYAGDTKVWDFTTNLPTSNVNIPVGSDIQGIVSAKDGVNGTKTAVIQMKSSSTSLYDAYPGAEFLVPVPSATSAGTVTRTGNVSKTRYLTIGTQTPVSLSSPMTFEFTSADVETNPTLSDNTNITGYYLRFTVSGGEMKTFGLTVTLTDGSVYGEASITHKVTYMDGNNTLKIDTDFVDGDKITYSPKKYGYDFDGWYLDSTLNDKLDDEYTVSSDIIVYAKWNEWTQTGIEKYTISNEAIGKISSGISENLTENLNLAPSIFTVMKGVSCTTTNVTLPNTSVEAQSPCFNTNGKMKDTEKGIMFIAPANGVLTAYVGPGGSSARNVILKNSSTNIEPLSGNPSLSSNNYNPVELTYLVEANTTYYLGGDNGVRIYYLNYQETTPLSDNATLAINAEMNQAKDTIRFVGKIAGNDIKDVKDINLAVTIGDVTKDIKFDIVYTAVTNTSFDCVKADKTYYILLRITGAHSLEGYKSKASLTVTYSDDTSKTIDSTEFTITTK